MKLDCIFQTRTNLNETVKEINKDIKQKEASNLEENWDIAKIERKIRNEIIEVIVFIDKMEMQEVLWE